MPGVARLGAPRTVTAATVGARDEHRADALRRITRQDTPCSRSFVVRVGVHCHQSQSPVSHEIHPWSVKRSKPVCGTAIRDRPQPAESVRCPTGSDRPGFTRCRTSTDHFRTDHLGTGPGRIDRPGQRGLMYQLAGRDRKSLAEPYVQDRSGTGSWLTARPRTPEPSPRSLATPLPIPPVPAHSSRRPRARAARSPTAPGTPGHGPFPRPTAR